MLLFAKLALSALSVPLNRTTSKRVLDSIVAHRFAYLNGIHTNLLTRQRSKYFDQSAVQIKYHAAVLSQSSRKNLMAFSLTIFRAVSAPTS